MSQVYQKLAYSRTWQLNVIIVFDKLNIWLTLQYKAPHYNGSILNLLLIFQYYSLYHQLLALSHCYCNAKFLAPLWSVIEYAEKMDTDNLPDDAQEYEIISLEEALKKINILEDVCTHLNNQMKIMKKLMTTQLSEIRNDIQNQGNVLF